MTMTSNISVFKSSDLLNALINALKGNNSKEEIFKKVKVAQACLTKAQKYPDAFSRKVFKSPTMLISNYGSKQCTTTASVLEALNEVSPELLKEFLQEEFNMFCRLVHLQVGESIPASSEYLKWSGKLFGVVAKKKAGISYNHPLTGFPVNIKEFKTENTEIRFRVFNKTTKTILRTKTSEINAQKTASTATPVCIHSIDAGILHKTKERFNDSMALVHDSFGTHPNKLSSMSSAINESLLEVAETPILQNIADQLIKGCEEEVAKAEKKSGLTLSVAPTQNTLKTDLKETILNSKYAFS